MNPFLDLSVTYVFLAQTVSMYAFGTIVNLFLVLLQSFICTLFFTLVSRLMCQVTKGVLIRVFAIIRFLCAEVSVPPIHISTLIPIRLSG